MSKRNNKLVWISLLSGVLFMLPLLASAASDKYGFKLTEARSDSTVDLEKLTDGKPLVFLVWSPDCAHCQRQMPYVASLYGKLDGERVNFYTCAVDAKVSAALDYMERKGLDVPVLDGKNGQLGSGLTAKGWPTTFVFAPGGDYVGYCDTTGSKYVDEVLAMVEKVTPELKPQAESIVKAATTRADELAVTTEAREEEVLN